MIISYRHEFIFIKTKKTAGSSIEHYLFPYLGATDICTGSSIDGTPSLNSIKKRKGHIGWRWIAEHKSQEWRDFFSFAVVRNPWETVVSAYHWLRHYNVMQGMVVELYPDFSSWVMGPIPLTFDPWPLFADHTGPRVDRVLRYEHLEQDIAQIPVPYSGELRTVRKKRTDHADYRGYYNDASRERVGNIFSSVIDYFDYRF